MHARSKSVQTPAVGDEAHMTFSLVFIQMGYVTVNSKCDMKIEKALERAH